ncbi:MAG TPA: amidohydrolase family protein [Anaerolineales bacterium]|nr:amidohydrolase family protein [Anaerolineales bacterium]
MSSLLLRSDLVVALDQDDHILKEGYIVIEDDHIAEMGLQKDLDSRRKFDEALALKNRLVMPGLINAHTHTPMTLFRGHVEGHSLFTMEGWYNTIRVLELEMEPQMLPGAVAVSCAEMIRTGTTCFADQYFWMDQIVPGVRRSGLRAALAYGIVELGDEQARERELAAAAAFLDGLKDDPLLDGWVGPHAFFVDNSEIAMQMELELAARHQTGFHIHFGTGDEEDVYCHEKYGHSAIQQLKQMGLLERPILAAHSITLPPADFATVAHSPFTVVFAPSSDMRNAAGVPPVIEMLAAGIDVALGTDNVTNNNSYDMFKEMTLTGKLMAFLKRDPAAISTRSILEMATLGGARALGKEKEIGSLEAGKKADLIALDLDEIGWAPLGGQDLYTALVYSVTGQHVRDVMVNGRWLFRENRWLTVDFPAARRELEQQHSELMKRVRQKGIHREKTEH